MKGLPFILILSTLAIACGGSENDTSSTLTADTSYRGKTEAAELNKISQISLVPAIFGTFQGEFENRPANQDDFQRLGLRFFLKKTQAMLQKLALEATQNQSYFSPSFSGLFGGKIDYSGNWNEQSGQVFLNFDGFSHDGHSSWSETVQLNFSNQTSGLRETHIIFDDFSFSTSTNTYILNGTLKHSYDISTQAFTESWDIHLQNGSTEIKLENYSEKGFKTNLEYTRSEFQGNFYHSELGKVFFNTSSTLECYGRTPCYGGAILIKGADGSCIKITPEGFGLLHFELDSNGDTEFESILSQSHSEVEVY